MQTPGNSTIRCLTIQQPWAWAITAGYKTVENRTWRTSYRGWVAIHAGASDAWMTRGLSFLRSLGVATPDNFDTGCITAVARLCNIATPENCDSPYACGPYCWELQNVHPLTRPIRLTGRQGLFLLPKQIETTLLHVLRF